MAHLQRPYCLLQKASPCLPFSLPVSASHRSSSSRKKQQRHSQAMASAGLPNFFLSDVLTVAGLSAFSVCWIKFFDLLTWKGILEQKLSRKVVHILTGPLYVVQWSLLSNADHARYLVLFLPIANLCRLVCAGMGFVKDPDLIKSVTRNNNVKELLGGPMLYTVVLACVTLLGWKSSIVGILAVSMMCGGDGLADIVGRRIGKTKLPYNREKSLEGSLAMIVGGSIISCGLLYFQQWTGALILPREITSIVLFTAVTSAIVESLSNNRMIDDNLSVPAAAAISAYVARIALGAT